MNRIFLFGDSIRKGYDRYVRDHMADEATVFYPDENCKFSSYLLRFMMEWIEHDCDPASLTLVHFNAGLWDCLRQDGEEPLVSPAEYEENLRRIVRRFRRWCPNTKLIFATSTPILEHGYGTPDRFFRYNAEIRQYNEIACRVMRENNIAIDDLYAVASALPEEAHSDATHYYTPMGTQVIGDAVLKSIREELAK